VAEAIEQLKAPKYAFGVQAGSKHRLRVVELYSVGWIRDFKGRDVQREPAYHGGSR